MEVTVTATITITNLDTRTNRRGLGSYIRPPLIHLVAEKGSSRILISKILSKDASPRSYKGVIVPVLCRR